MDAHISESGRPANPAPWFLQVLQMRSLLSANDHIRVAIETRQVRKNLDGWLRQKKGFLTALRVGQP